MGCPSLPMEYVTIASVSHSLGISGDYVNTRLSHLQRKKISLAQGASFTLPSLSTSFRVSSSPEQTSGWQLVQWKGKPNLWSRLVKE